MPDKPGRAAEFMVDAENGDRKNARVADKLMLALPRELNPGQRAALVRGFAEDVTQGRASWLAAFHDQGKDAQNPHVHLLIRDRDLATGRRVAGLSEQGSTERLRVLWEDHANRALGAAGRPERIDRRTLKAQSIDRAPTVHEGPRAQQMERRGARPQSRMRRYRNRPGAPLPHREVDYRGIDAGRSRPAYNRHIRETSADYWQALDADNQARELDQLRAIHHRPVSVIPFTARRSVPHGIVNQHSIGPGVHSLDLKSFRLPESMRSRSLFSVPPVSESEITPTQRIARGAAPEKTLAPPEGPTKQPAESIEQNIKHNESIKNKILSDKGKIMSVDDEEKRRLTKDLADALAREQKSRAARNNALDNGFMRPDLAKPDINQYYKNKGVDKLKERFNQYPWGSQFGVKKGNPLTKEGRKQRADANQARRDLPDLWDTHANDLKNRKAAERAFNDRYPKPEGQDAPPTGPAQSAGMPPPDGQQSPVMTPTQQGMGQGGPSGSPGHYDGTPPGQVPQETPSMMPSQSSPAQATPQAGPAHGAAPQHVPQGHTSPTPAQQPISMPAQPREPTGAQTPSFLSKLPNARATPGQKLDGEALPSMDNLQYPPPSFLSKLPNAHRTPMDGRPAEGRPPKARPGPKPRGVMADDD
ncbi:MobA/MobL family protein [Rhizobium sp. PP-CC-3G-465]|nr:MobA/MobL family protein [Rhizobium sp. PP-CC-3G-465]